MSYADLRSILPHLPRLQRLEFGYNRVRSLELPYDSPGTRGGESLQHLNLDGNDISDWASLCASLQIYGRQVEPSMVLVTA